MVNNHILVNWTFSLIHLPHPPIPQPLPSTTKHKKQNKNKKQKNKNKKKTYEGDCQEPWWMEAVIQKI